MLFKKFKDKIIYFLELMVSDYKFYAVTNNNNFNSFKYLNAEVFY